MRNHTLLKIFYSTNYLSKKITRLKIEIKRGYYLNGSGNLLKEAMKKYFIYSSKQANEDILSMYKILNSIQKIVLQVNFMSDNLKDNKETANAMIKAANEDKKRNKKL